MQISTRSNRQVVNNMLPLRDMINNSSAFLILFFLVRRPLWRQKEIWRAADQMNHIPKRGVSISCICSLAATPHTSRSFHISHHAEYEKKALWKQSRSRSLVYNQHFTETHVFIDLFCCVLQIITGEICCVISTFTVITPSLRPMNPHTPPWFA